MNKTIEKIFPYLLLIPAFLPLLYAGGLLFPYITVKVLLLRGLAIVLLTAFLYLCMKGNQFYFSRLKSKVTILPALFLVSAYISSLLNPGFFHGFWSSFERGDGLLTLTAVVIYFYIFIVYANREFVEKFLKTVAIVAGIVSIYAIFQWIQTVSGINIPLIEETRGRIGGSFNNAAFLSGYLMLTLPITWLVRDWVQKKKWVNISFILQFITVFITATRGAILALLAAAFVFIVLNIIKEQGVRKKRAIQILVSLVVVLGLFVSFRTSLQDSNITLVKRLASISLTEGTAANRLFLWKEMIPYTLEKPFFGFGQENIDVIFNEIYDPSDINEPWFDRSHNMVVDHLLQSGIVGLALYLLIILSIIYLAIRSRNKSEDELFYVSILLVTMYFVHNLFVFDTSVTLWTFFMFFAAMYILVQDEFREQNFVFTFEKYAWIALFILFSLLPVIVEPFRANRLLVKAHGHMQTLDTTLFIEDIEKGYELGTYADIEYGYNVYTWYLEMLLPHVPEEDLGDVYRVIVHILEKNYELYPDDTRTTIYLAHLLSLKPVTVDPTELTYTFEEMAQKTIDLSPKRDQMWFILINKNIVDAETSHSDTAMASYSKAIEAANQYIEAVPEDSTIYFLLANIYNILNQPENVNSILEKGVNYYNGDSEAAQYAMRFYIEIEDWSNALKYGIDFIEGNEGVLIESVYDLAKLYFLNEEYEKSAAIYRQILEQNRNLALSDPAFVSAIEPFLTQNDSK